MKRFLLSLIFVLGLNSLAFSADPAGFGFDSARVDKQTISLTTPSPMTVGDADQTLTFSTTSGLTVALTTNDAGICTIVSQKLHAVGAGTCVVYANQAGHPMWLAGAQITSGNVTISASSDPCTGANPSDCTFRETFEGSTLCYSGMGSTCDHTYAYATGFNFNYTAAPLQGSRSAQATGGADAEITSTGLPAAAEYYATAIWKSTATIPTTLYPLVLTHGGSDACKMEIYANTTSGDVCASNSGGTLQCTSGGVLSVNTTYYLRIRGKKVGATTCECEAWYSTDGINWGTSKLSTNGTWNANIDGFKFQSNTNGEVIDDVRFYTGIIHY